MGDLRLKGGGDSEPRRLPRRARGYCSCNKDISTGRGANGHRPRIPGRREGSGRARGFRDHAANYCSVMPANRGTRLAQRGRPLSSQRFSSPVSAVRMRTARSIGRTKILPSPMAVRRRCCIASIVDFDLMVADAISRCTFGRKGDVVFGAAIDFGMPLAGRSRWPR